MPSLNKAIIMGHLGKDPESHATSAGKLIVKFPVATTESWKDKTTGEWINKTEWHNVVIFAEGLAKYVEDNVRKGDLVYIEGQLKTNKWMKDGIDRYNTTIVLQGFDSILKTFKKKGESSVSTGGAAKTVDSQAPIDTNQDFDDEIPF